MKISIVTPTYNSEKFLSETIESVLTQRGAFHIQYIVIDGGSTDNTLNILEEYARLVKEGRYSKYNTSIDFKYITEPDKGMYDAIAKGFKMVTGDIVAYINSDDYYLPNAFTAVTQTFNKLATVKWLTGRINVYNETGSIIHSMLPFYYDRKFIKKGVYGNELPFIQQESCFWRGELLRKIDLNKFASYQLAGDYFLWHEFSNYADLRIITSPISGFRTHENNKSNNMGAYKQEFGKIVSHKRTVRDRLVILYHKLFWRVAGDKIKRTFANKKVSHLNTIVLYGDLIKDEATANSKPEEHVSTKSTKLVSTKNKQQAKVSVIIGSYNRLPLLKLCISGVRDELAELDHEIIVIDGGSTDGALKWLTQQKDIVTIVQHNRGEWQGQPIKRRSWGYFMNLGFKASQGKYICMLSDDSLIVPGAIVNGYNLFEQKLSQGIKLGALAFYFRDFPIRKKYAVAVNLGNLYVNHGLYLNAALEEVGYVSEDEYHFYFADTDLVLKMKEKGYECIASPESFVEHYFEATPEIRQTNNDDKKEADRLHLIDKWSGRAYKEKEKEYYKKTVGYWDYIETDFVDSTNTIDKLISAK